MKYIVFALLWLSALSTYSQMDTSLIFPDSTGWNVLNEDEVLSFQVKTMLTEDIQFSIEGAEGLNIQF